MFGNIVFIECTIELKLHASFPIDISLLFTDIMYGTTGQSKDKGPELQSLQALIKTDISGSAPC